MTNEELVKALRDNAEWCDANEYDVPLCMGDNQRTAADLIESLQAQLAESQRRERAAVEDINSVRMCHTCKHFLREFGMGGIECKMPCATIRHENFEWRGPQAGKGDAPNE